MMEPILDEFDHFQIEESQLKATENAMMAKGDKGKGKKLWKGTGLLSGETTNPDVECWTWGDKDHFKNKCPKRSKKKSGTNRGKDQEVYTFQPEDDYAFSPHLVSEALARTTVDSIAGSITIYNSEAMVHMSPSRDKFVNFRKIEPKGVKAANKAIFLATGVGFMKINVPNGKDSTTVVLEDVLNCLDLGYMLVSLAECNMASFMVLL